MYMQLKEVNIYSHPAKGVAHTGGFWGSAGRSGDSRIELTVRLMTPCSPAIDIKRGKKGSLRRVCIAVTR